ncbi:hypothetical protein Csa_023847 [Cucumis sativus]|nr:hypothetical protein Csa_023847 [Cucumis sativus]
MEELCSCIDASTFGIHVHNCVFKNQTDLNSYFIDMVAMNLLTHFQASQLPTSRKYTDQSILSWNQPNNIHHVVK